MISKVIDCLKKIKRTVRRLTPNIIKRYWYISLPINKSLWTYLNVRQVYEKYLMNSDYKQATIRKIGIAINDISILYHYLPIIKYLDKGQYVFILAYEKRRDLKKIISHLDQKKLPYEFPHKIIQERKRYKVILSHCPPIGRALLPPFNYGNTSFLEHMGNIQVKLSYGGGKLKWNCDERNQLYNHIFCYGPYYKSIFKKVFSSSEVHEIGYPRFDALFEIKEPKEILLKKLGSKANKKIICYLPTHGPLTSINDAVPLINNLKKDYIIIIKAHPRIKSELNVFKNDPDIFIIDSDENNIKCFYLADYIIADYGGSVLGSIYADKNLLLLNIKNPFKDEFNMCEESPDILVRSQIKSFFPTQIKEIKSSLLNQKQWAEQKKIRSSLRKKFFKFSPRSGESAASVLKTILETQ
jgi:hypothetical protein